MKKLVFFILLISSFFLFSCATSGSIQDTQNNQDSAVELQTYENTDDSDVTDIDETIDLSSDTENEEEEFQTYAQLYPELDEIIEPEIVTLEPEEIIESNEDETENEQQSELVETELPAEEPVVLISTEDTNQTETSNDENHEFAISDENNVQKTDSELNFENNEDTAIDISNDDNSALANEENVKIETEINPSRKVTMKLFEYLDVTYPGSGWVFMGLTDNSKDLTYHGKNLANKDSKFILQARNPGIKILHFYKEDLIKNEYIDDYIEVEILEEKGLSKTHITAPSYKQALPKKAKKIITQNEEQKAKKIIQLENENKPSTNETTNTEKKVVQKSEQKAENQVNTAQKAQKIEKNVSKSEPVENEVLESVNESATVEKSLYQNIDQNTLLKEAQLLYNEKEYKAAKDKIEEFLGIATNKTDEGLYLKGQILEAKSEIQNIKAAIDAYTTLTKNYPGSKYWENSNKRIIYLKRFYMEVR